MIDISLVETLINQQFPQYKNLTIKKVKTQGHDNTTFHLGQNFIASFPNAASYGETIENQYRLLGKIQSYISIELSQTIEIGKASRLFPYPWSIKTYIKGKSSNLTLESIDREKFAVSIGTVLHQFKSIHFSQEEINLLIPSKKKLV
jgi:aminoglycoside phosphotransferase (APT) family kinase protein